MRSLLLLLVAFCVLLIASFAAEAAKVGTKLQSPPLITFTGPEEVVIEDGRWGLHHIPDGPISFIRRNGTVHLWFAATYYLRGLDFNQLEPHLLDESGNAIPVLTGTGIVADFDSHYAGSGAIFRAANGSDLIMFYHAENHACGPSVPYVSIATARSSDGGATWQRQGRIVTSPEPPAPCDNPRFNGAGSFSVTKSPDGLYYYLYYMEWLAETTDEIRLARAPIATDGAPETWYKYDGTDFTQPGLGGSSSVVIRRASEEAVYAGIPSVSFNTYLNRYLAIIVGNTGFYYTTSIDGIQWQELIHFWDVQPLTDPLLQPGEGWWYYPTLLSLDQDTSQTTGKTGYLYYAYGIKNQTPHYMMRRAVQIGYVSYSPVTLNNTFAATPTPTRPPSVNLSPGQSFPPPPGWTWICNGDFSIIVPSGGTVPLYDQIAETGLILILQPNSQFIVNAPWGGYCEAFHQAEVDAGLQTQLNIAFSEGCVGGCATVNVKELDPTGITVRDEWWSP
jgi:hypothetical protein